MGGSDVANKTPILLKQLTKIYPNLNKNVIVGGGFSNVAEIFGNADNNTKIIVSPDAQAMKNEMLMCDIAISSAGQTLYELARIGVPTYAIKVADNQYFNIINWKKSGFLLTENILLNLPDFSLRTQMSSIGREIVDGKGVFRIYERIIND